MHRFLRRAKKFNPEEAEYLTQDCKDYVYQTNSHSICSEDMKDVDWQKQAIKQTNKNHLQNLIDIMPEAG